MNAKRNPVPKVGDTKVIDPQLEGSDASTSQAVDQKEIRTLIARRHPQYEENHKHWCFLEQTYDGGRDWFKDNIFRYMKEGDKEYQDRISRAYRFNHTREVVDLTTKYLFKQTIVRNEEDAKDVLKEFWLSCTRNGISIKEFSRQIGKQTSIYGRIGIVVDRTTAEGVIVSQADEKKAGIKTYAYIVPPEQILDYSYDDQGHLNWILLVEQHRDDKDPLKSSGKVTMRYRLWTKDSWYLIEEDVKKARGAKTYTMTTGEHGLGSVPVILADHIISDDLYVSPAMIDDIAYLDRAVANYLSNLDAVIQDQTFSQLAMPSQGIAPGDDNNAKMIEIGTKRIFTYDGGDGNSKPFFLSPDVKQSGLLLEVINKIINEIYHTVGLAGERTKQDNALGIDNSSGVAKAYDFERVNALLVAKANSLEFVENRIADLVLKWSGIERSLTDEKLVTYPENFDTRGLYDEFDIAARLMLVEAPDGIRREQMMSVLDKLFPQLPKEKRAALEKELEHWPVAVVVEDNSKEKSVISQEVKAKVKKQTPASDAGNKSSQANG